MRFSATLMLTALIAASLHPVEAKTLLVPQQYPTIGGALKAAKTGDTVLVSPKPNGGAYAEAVTISTPGITLQGSNNPVIDGTTLGVPYNDPPFGTQLIFPVGIDILASHVTVSGFTIRNFYAASTNPYNSTNFGNSAINVGDSNANGVFVTGGNVTISGNFLTNDLYGITITGYTGGNPLFGLGGTYLSGYQVVGNTITGSDYIAVSITSGQALIAGNRITNTYSDGMDINGEALTVSGNEIGNSGGLGVNAQVASYNPAVNNAASPNPAPTLIADNNIHDNATGGVSISYGTVSLTGNVVANSTYQGIYLSDADYSQIVGNVVIGSKKDALAGYDGQGILASFDSADAPNSLTISGNQVIDSAGKGIDIEDIAGCLVSQNFVFGSGDVGIYDYGYTSGFLPPNTFTRNVALYNGLTPSPGTVGFDAVDGYSAPTTTAYTTYYGTPVYGEGLPQYDVWKGNVFGKADPVGISK